MSIADLSAACELTQIGFLNYDVSQHKTLHEWHQRVLAIPEVQEAHKEVFAAYPQAEEKPN